MKKTLAAILLAAAVAGPGIVLAQDADNSRPSHIVKDSAITTMVKTKLAAEHLRSLTHLHVATDENGVVWLRGTVRSQETADRAIAIARNTDGVTDVHSHIRVVAPSS
jgi:hyperosmotically inducible protein